MSNAGSSLFIGFVIIGGLFNAIALIGKCAQDRTFDDRCRKVCYPNQVVVHTGHADNLYCGCATGEEQPKFVKAD